MNSIRHGEGFLRDISEGVNFNRWMYDQLAPAMGKRIVEVGSGIGNISRLLPARELLTVTDHDPAYVEKLEITYGDQPNTSVAKLDLNSDADIDALAPNRYDTVVCLNVLEHIEDDRGALDRMGRLLIPGGRLVLLAPQYQALYGSFDRMVGHYRRYNRAGLGELVTDAGYRIESTRGFNVLSMAGWWFNAVLMQRDRIGTGQMKLFDSLVPILRVVEAPLTFTGLSLIMILRKG